MVKIDRIDEIWQTTTTGSSVKQRDKMTLTSTWYYVSLACLSLADEF